MIVLFFLFQLVVLENRENTSNVLLNLAGQIGLLQLRAQHPAVQECNDGPGNARERP